MLLIIWKQGSSLGVPLVQQQRVHPPPHALNWEGRTSISSVRSFEENSGYFGLQSKGWLEGRGDPPPYALRWARE